MVGPMPNFSFTSADYLVTYRNDPMGVEEGLYLKVPLLFGSIFLRLNLASKAKRRDFENYTNIFHSLYQDQPFDILNGGPDEHDALFLLHDGNAKIKATIDVRSPVLCLTAFPDIVRADSMKVPLLRRVLMGCCLITEADLRAHTEKGMWAEFNAPACIAFGTNLSNLKDTAEKHSKVVSAFDESNMKSAVESMLSGVVAPMLGSAAEFQLSGIRTAVWLRLVEQRKISGPQVEKIIDAYVALQGHEMTEITTLMESYSEGEVIEKLRQLEMHHNLLELPIVAKNAEMNDIVAAIGLERHLYDWAVFQCFVSSTKKPNSSDEKSKKRSASIRGIKEKMDRIIDIAKAKGRSD